MHIGIPYKPKGRSSDGCDCWGYVKLRYEEDGHGVKDYEYSEDEINPEVFENLYKDFTEVHEIKPGYMLQIADKYGNPSHVGYVEDEIYFTHCLDKVGVVRSKISTWRKRIIGIFKHDN